MDDASRSTIRWLFVAGMPAYWVGYAVFTLWADPTITSVGRSPRYHSIGLATAIVPWTLVALRLASLGRSRIAAALLALLVVLLPPVEMHTWFWLERAGLESPGRPTCVLTLFLLGVGYGALSMVGAPAPTPPDGSEPG